MNAEEERAACAESSAYAILKAMTDDAELRDLAKAVAGFGIPEEKITKAYLGRLLFNRQVYSDCDDLRELVAATHLKGVHPRRLGKRAKDRVGRRHRTRAPKESAAPAGDATGRFAKACALARPSCADITFPPFAEFMRKGMAAWKADSENAVNGMGRLSPVAQAAASALRAGRLRAEGEGGRALALVPIDRYLATILAGRSYSDNIGALREVAGAVRSGLASPVLAGRRAFVESKLPAGKPFRDHMIAAGGTPYDESYFLRHQISVWNDMLACWAFSAVGRDADARTRSRDLIAAMARSLPGDARSAAGRWMPNGGLVEILRDAGPDTFGHRVALFGVYEAVDAELLAEAAAEARARLYGRNLPKAEAARRILGADLAVHGCSLTSEVPVQDMRKFGRLYGRLMLWE